MFITIYQHPTVIFHLFDPQKTGWHQQLWILLKLHLLKGWKKTDNNGQRQRLKPATWIQPGLLWIIRGQTNKLLLGFTHVFPGGCSLEKISWVSSKILNVWSSYLHLGNLRIKCRNIHHLDGYIYIYMAYLGKNYPKHLRLVEHFGSIIWVRDSPYLTLFGTSLPSGNKHIPPWENGKSSSKVPRDGIC